MKKTKPNFTDMRVHVAYLGVLCTAVLLLAVSDAPDEVDPRRAKGRMNLVSGRFLGQNLVSNGGFEGDSSRWNWVQDATLSTDTVHSGANALKTSGADTTRFAYVWQELNFAYDTTEVTFWVYPASDVYYHFIELIANWRPGPATIITRVTLTENAIAFRALDVSAGIPNVLIPNAWNKITMQANSGTLTQDFYVNDSLYSTLTVPEFPMAEHLLVGDLSGKGNYGTLFYDDISITGSVVSPEPIAVNDQFVDDGPEAKFFPILQNDVLPQGATIAISIETPPQHGQILSIEEDGIWFQKEEGFEGADQLSYSLAVLGQGSTKKTRLTGGATMIYQAFVCACFLVTSSKDYKKCIGKEQRIDPLGKRFGPDYASLIDSLDLNLLIRWRDELLRTTVAGAALFDDLTFNSPEILQIVLFDQPDLHDRIAPLFLMLQDPARSLLEGDGSEVITQAQMDSVAAFFASLRAASSRDLSQQLQADLMALGPLDNYVGLTVQEAYELLGNPAGTAIEEELPETATGFVLEQNFPNPFVTATQIRYTLERPTAVSLAIYDIRGRRVKTLADGRSEQGVQTVTWNGMDERGIAVPSGVYFVRLSTDTFQQAKRMVVVN